MFILQNPKIVTVFICYDQYFAVLIIIKWIETAMAMTNNKIRIVIFSAKKYAESPIETHSIAICIIFEVMVNPVLSM